MPTPPPNFRDENYYETNINNNNNKKGGILGFLKRHFTKSTPALREQDYSDEEDEQMRAARSAHLQHLLRHLAARSLEQEQGWRRRIEERRRRDEEERRRGIFHSQRKLRNVSAEEGERRWEFEMWRRRFQEQKRREEENVLRRVGGRRRRGSQRYLFRAEEDYMPKDAAKADDEDEIRRLWGLDGRGRVREGGNTSDSHPCSSSNIHTGYSSDSRSGPSGPAGYPCCSRRS